MTSLLPRRAFLVGVPAGVIALDSMLHAEAVAGDQVESADVSGVHPEFPTQPPALAREVVGKSHFDLEIVKGLIKDRPSLARASWDWGFGDWETALGAASHVGRHDIVELLMAHGARPNLFTFAMLDHVDVVRAAIEASPGIQRIHGPHGITLLAHARNGEAQRVIDYLETVGGADELHESIALPDDAKPKYIGTYRFGPGDEGTLVVADSKVGLRIQRGANGSARPMLHLGNDAFHPSGTPHVRIQFSMGPDGTAMVTVHDADLIVTARRAPG